MPTTLRLTARQFAALKPSKVQRASGSSVRAQAGGEQMRLGLTGRERKATMTVAELKRTRKEKDIRDEIRDACRMYPAVAWCERFEAFRGYVLPFANHRGFIAALRRQATWTPAAVLVLLRGFIVVRDFGAEGAPDLIGQLRGGQVLGLECKRVGEKPTAEQEAWLNHITRCGGCAAVVHDAREAIQRIESFVATHA